MLLLLGCVPPPSDTCSLTPPEPGALHTDGVQVRDEHDRIVSLRGVNAGGRSKFAPYLPFDFAEGGTGERPFDDALAAYLDRAASWGITVLRVPFSWAALEPVEGQDDAAWLARYHALVDGAWDRGIWSIVDHHQDVYGEFYCGDGFPRWTVEDPGPDRHDCADWFTGYLSDDEVSAAFDAFWSDETGVRTKHRAMWTRMATPLVNHPGVIGYEPLNEPGWGSASATTWAATTLTSFYGEIAGHLNEVDPDALVFFDATGLEAVVAQTSLGLPDGENLVFAPHYYDPAVIAGAGSVSADVQAELGDWAAQGEAWGVPVLVGEYGVDHDLAEATSYMEDHYAAFDEHGMHATWWQYSVAAEAWNFEDLDLVEADGTERAPVDVLVRPVARAVAGENVTASWDGAVYALVFDAVAGVTEVTLPTRLFPDGATVRTEGLCADVRADRVYLEAPAPGPVRVEIGP